MHHAPRSSFMQGFVPSLMTNIVGMAWLLSMLAFGGMGAGMSSAPTSELQNTFLSFVGLGLCCPASLNVILLAVLAFVASRRRDWTVLTGWAAGLGLSVGGGVCLAALGIGALVALNILL